MAEIDIVTDFEVRWEPEDRIPVMLGETVVGIVKRVQTGRSRIGETLYVITVDIADDVWKSVNYEQALNGGPSPLHIFFPRPLNELNTNFVFNV